MVRRQLWAAPHDVCTCGECTNDVPAKNLMQLPASVCGAVERHWMHKCCWAAGEWADAAAGGEYPTCPRCALQRRMLRCGASDEDEHELEGDVEGDGSGRGSGRGT